MLWTLEEGRGLGEKGRRKWLWIPMEGRVRCEASNVDVCLQSNALDSLLFMVLI